MFYFPFSHSASSFLCFHFCPFICLYFPDIFGCAVYFIFFYFVFFFNLLFSAFSYFQFGFLFFRLVSLYSSFIFLFACFPYLPPLFVYFPALLLFSSFYSLFYIFILIFSILLSLFLIFITFFLPYFPILPFSLIFSTSLCNSHPHTFTFHSYLPLRLARGVKAITHVSVSSRGKSLFAPGAHYAFKHDNCAPVYLAVKWRFFMKLFSLELETGTNLIPNKNLLTDCNAR